MESLIAASFAGRTAEGARFTFENGWECRLFVLDDTLFRVLFVRPEGLREPRTWMVAPEGIDVPWEGRDRLDVTGFARPAFDVEARDGRVVVKTATLEAHVRLRPFGIDWSTPGGPRFAADRPTFAYQWSARTGVVRHDMARLSADRYFGLGDKTGPLDKHGRRLRTLALDALGYDAETGDPLYKHWPYLIARDGATGTAYGVFYDTLAAATFDLGCEHDNYHGFYRYCEIDGGDLDYYLFVGPRIRDVVGKFAELTGRMAFGPRWSLGYANTAMSLTDAADAQTQPRRFHRQRREARHPHQRVPFRLGLQQHRSAPLRVHVEPQQVSRTGVRSSSDSSTRRFDSSPTSSRACSTITRPSPKWPGAALSSTRRRAPCRRSASSGTARARTSTSRIRKAFDGGSNRSRASSSTTAFSGGTTTTNTRSGTSRRPRTVSGSRYRSSARARCSRC